MFRDSVPQILTCTQILNVQITTMVENRIENPNGPITGKEISQ